MLERNDLDGAVVVITGASSGLARATALHLSVQGSRLVLAARGEAALDEVAAECRANGAEVEVVPTDIRDVEAVEALRRRTIERFGRIDIWIEAAAQLIAGRLGQETAEEDRALVETNVLGSLYGARAAMVTFEEQGRGTLIMVSSLLGMIPSPLAPVYAMSKFAMRGLALSLRQATLRLPHVHVCVVVPGPIDTPIFEHGANHTGHQLRAIPPAAAPERVAAAVVSCARRPRRQVTSGVLPHLIVLTHRVTPRLVEWSVARWSATLLTRGPAEEPNPGQVFVAPESEDLHGGWRLGRTRRQIGEWVGRRLGERGAPRRTSA